MIIRSIETFQVAVPLKKAFKTALRTVTVAEAIYVRIQLDDGREGFGEAPPTHVITGESLASIQFAIEEVFKPLLIGKDLRYHEQLFQSLHRSMVHNTSAKAAIDMALYDLLAQEADLPLYQYLGGARSELITDYTVSVNEPIEMAQDAISYVRSGFQILKIKVGIGEIEEDIKRIKAIRKAVGVDIKLRLDANQGWTAKEAVRAIGQMEDEQLNIEFIEQPVLAHDIEGLKYVTDHTLTPIMADESVFSIYDAKRVIEMRAADLINIKLMKAGGIYQALKIASLAASHDMKCMTGSMIETKLGVGAAAHFAASQSNIIHYDFDAPLMLKEDLLEGGIQYDGSKITFDPSPGLGIVRINKGGN
ncbi:dipeptide epimerase [Rummeliibacillus sp. NPDC094406]|uniref:dipeptide epimerase n=1 Tax=Rummeliibacillus sp. NPDC094406 TaxID=3364511 RepID=UPI0038126734